MKILTEGHRYQLASFEGGPEQVLQFIEKHSSIKGSTELMTRIDGTTNEEVLLMLIDRLQYLNGKFPCMENGLALVHLKDALAELEKRTASRRARGVAGTAVV